jgi:hypothetical protein
LRLELFPFQQKSATGQEIGEMVCVLVAREPVFDARGVVQGRVTPLQIDGRGGPAATRRTPKIFFI